MCAKVVPIADDIDARGVTAEIKSGNKGQSFACVPPYRLYSEATSIMIGIHDLPEPRNTASEVCLGPRLRDGGDTWDLAPGRMEYRRKSERKRPRATTKRSNIAKDDLRRSSKGISRGSSCGGSDFRGIENAELSVVGGGTGKVGYSTADGGIEPRLPLASVSL